MRVMVARSAFLRCVAASAAAAAGFARGATAPRSPGAASIRAVGRSYLAAHPHEADASYLSRTLSAGRPTDLAGRVRRDFARADVVVINGWIVARSEARTCALASLAADDAD